MGSVYLRGGFWYVQYRAANGRLKRESVGKDRTINKTIARKILEGKERQEILKENNLVDAEIPTFDEITPEYLHHQKEIKQIRSFVRTAQAVSHFSKIFGAKKLNEITASDIDKQRRLIDGIKLNTIVRDLVVIRHVFSYAYRHRKFFGRNPVSEAGLPQINDKKERVLAIKEQEDLLKHCSPDLAFIIRLTLNTGMRRDEVLFIKWEWIDFKENLINVPHTHSKSKRSRRLPINSVARKDLLELRLRSTGEHVLNVSPTAEGTRTWLQREFKEACDKAGIEGLRFHDLRHTAATRLVEAGIPLHAVAELLGHSSIRMTERYSHPQESVKKAAEVLANFS